MFHGILDTIAGAILPDFDQETVSSQYSSVQPEELTDEEDDDEFEDDEEESIFSYILDQTPIAGVFGCLEKTSLIQKKKKIEEALSPNGFSLIMGYIQSGKSKVLFGSSLFLARILKRNVIIILRNYTSDADQFLFNFQLGFLEGLREVVESGTTEDIVSVRYTGDLVKRQNGILDPSGIQDIMNSGLGSVIVALANQTQLLCLNELLSHVEEPPTVFIDEVDDTLYSTGLCGDQIKCLTERSNYVIGVSATVFDPLHDSRFVGSNVYLLNAPPNYKGVDRFITTTIDPLSGGDDDMNLRLEKDHDLVRVLDTCRSTTIQSGNKDHPLILLLKNERVISDQMKLLEDITTMYGSDYVVIVHNGQNTSLFAPRLRYSSSPIRLPTSHKKPLRVGDNGLYVFSKAQIQDVLQLLKNSGGAKFFPRIIIISHDIIGRGINVASRDFEWHLTHMFYRPSKTATIPMFLQSMRLAGISEDNIPRYLYAEEKVLTDIMIGHRLQQEVVERICKKATEEKTTTEILQGEVFHSKKIPKRSLFLLKNKRSKKFLPKIDDKEDKGWSMEEFMRPLAITKNLKPINKDTLPILNTFELNRLVNSKNGMFKKWGNPTCSSAISKFLREGVDPNKIYSKTELKTVCKEFKINIHNISSPGYGKKSNKNYGQIFISPKDNKNVIVFSPQLLPYFQIYF
jgi:hypothetical protein